MKSKPEYYFDYKKKFLSDKERKQLSQTLTSLNPHDLEAMFDGLDLSEFLEKNR